MSKKLESKMRRLKGALLYYKRNVNHVTGRTVLLGTIVT